MTQAQKAVIISAKTLREADILVRFATPNGRLSAVANSARRSKRRFPGGFPSGSQVEITCVESKSPNLYNLQEMRIIESFLGIEVSHTMLGAIGFALELVDRTWPEHQASPEKFTCLSRFLSDLPHQNLGITLQKFCWDWLGLLGFQPMLTQCVRCEAIAQTYCNWSIFVNCGGVLCPQCSSRESGGIPMSGKWQQEVIPLWIKSVLDINLKSNGWWKLVLEHVS